MSEQELFDEKTFVKLFNMSELERIGFENKLYLVAKEYNEEKKFEKTLKRYEKIFKDKIPLAEDYILPKCKYDIENFNFGSYICDKTGIKDKNNNKFSYFPVIPVERYINNETNKEKVKIIFYKENEWKELILDKSQLAISQKLLLLSDNGLDVNSENVKHYIKYFNEVMNLNDIHKLSSISHIGWNENDFIPYDTHGIFDGVNTFKPFYEALSSKGNPDKWYNLVSKLRKNKYLKLIMATTFASPLLEKLSIPSFIMNVWSSMSGSGKTLSCMVAMSAWGNPRSGALMLSSNNTQNFYVSIASFMKNITCYFDELQIIKHSKEINFNNLIMDLCNGTEKGRLTKESQVKEIKTWKNNFLFTNNDKMVNENAGEQIYNRVIDLEITDKLYLEEPQTILSVILDNYGFVGKEYIKYIKEVGFDAIRGIYKAYFDEITRLNSGTDKQATTLAILLTADKLICDCLFKEEQPLTCEDIMQFDLINDSDEIKTANKAGKYIVDIINANINKFNTNNYGEIWGCLENGGHTVKINKQILCRELERAGFDFNTVKREWANINFLVKNDTYGFQHLTSVYGQVGYYVVLNK